MNDTNIRKVVVLDMQPIDPPVGGGRLRLLGLYHGLGEKLPTTYIGTYDWPGEKFRKHHLSNTLEEINIPLSNEHFLKCAEWQKQVGGKTIIDTAFHQLAHLSSEFVNYAKEEVTKADIVIFSHPWVYPLVRDELREYSQLIVYDAHNMEGLLRATLLDDGNFGTKIVKEAVKVEYELCHIADLVLACSHEDRKLFNRVYQVPFKKIRVVSNGVFLKQMCMSDHETKKKAKKKLGLNDRVLAIFIGSSYPPNTEAANFICNTLAPELPEITFAICGGVGEGLDKKLIEGKENIFITGVINEKDKYLYLAAADLAINPMFSGSGTNIKMFDFMAAGLPIITTPVGARGIEKGSHVAFKTCYGKNFVSEIRKVSERDDLKRYLANSARSLVEEKYIWERISTNLGTLLHKWCNTKSIKRPFFTIIIPTFERPDHLSKLMNFLSVQRWKDFEVIIVDQSREKWSGRNEDYGFDCLYIHTHIKGAVKARNMAAFYARGEVLAFIDDDCEPMQDWLQNARPYFDRTNIVGIEGLIKSDKHDDPDYRAVSNEGFKGIGFMSANLFLKLGVFNAINGFDERFDNPHFREDTDLAWRALDYGEIPFAHDVEVFHPPHPRNIERESITERVRFFEKDALLLRKHPNRYKKLFLMEGHWKNTPYFWENFLTGSKKYGVEIPEDYLTYYKSKRKGTVLFQ